MLDGAPVFHGLFSNEEKFRGDHVACFVIRQFTRREWKQTVEIRETGFFPVTNLPEGTTSGTRRRIEEVVAGKAPSHRW